MRDHQARRFFRVCCRARPLMRVGDLIDDRWCNSTLASAALLITDTRANGDNCRTWHFNDNSRLSATHTTVGVHDGDRL